MRSSPPWLKTFLAPIKIPVYKLLNKFSDDHWGEQHLDSTYWKGGIHWGDLPEIQAYINKNISGEPATDFIKYSNLKYLKPLRKKYSSVRMLSLCCGIGSLELNLIQQGIVDEVIGYDASSACIENRY